MSQWAKGQFSSEDPTVTHAANAGALEKLNAYQEIEELDYDQYIEVMTDEQSERTQAIGSGSFVRTLRTGV